MGWIDTNINKLYQTDQKATEEQPISISQRPMNLIYTQISNPNSELPIQTRSYLYTQQELCLAFRLSQISAAEHEEARTGSKEMHREKYKACLVLWTGSGKEIIKEHNQSALTKRKELTLKR